MSTTPLSGQTTVLIGGTGNIGPGLISAQLEAGATVVVLGRNEARLEATRNQFPHAADRILTVVGDVGSLASAEQAAADIFAKAGQIDHVVIGLNAWMQGEPFWSVSEKTWQRTLDITSAYFAAARALTPHIRSGGSLTMIHGLAFYVTLPVASPITIYGGALRAMRPAFSQDLGDRVRVNAAAFAQITSASRGANISPDWLTDEQVGRVMTHLAASDLTGLDLKIPDQPTYQAVLAGDVSRAAGSLT